MTRAPILLAGFVVMAASLLGGCSDSRVTASAITAPSARSAEQRPVPAAKTSIGESFASAALDDSRLGEIRGGLNTGSGLIVNFSFQEATYVNNNLTHSIAVPTVTIVPGPNPAGMTTSSGLVPSSLAPTGTSMTQAQVSSPAMAVQSLLNSGMTSVVSSLGGGGISNTISNAANNQLVQQVITANIDIKGLSQTVQQSVTSTVLSRLAAGNAQFR
jgi:hypothetical protein